MIQENVTWSHLPRNCSKATSAFTHLTPSLEFPRIVEAVQLRVLAALNIHYSLSLDGLVLFMVAHCVPLPEVKCWLSRYCQRVHGNDAHCTIGLEVERLQG